MKKQASTDTVYGRDELVYTLRYDNIGNQVATGVVLTDTLWRSRAWHNKKIVDEEKRS